jgi:hypothetical protein
MLCYRLLKTHGRDGGAYCVNIMKGFLLCLLLFFCSVNPLWAVPASSFQSEALQPDGTKVRLVQKGDESAHWIETPKGFTVVKNPKSGYWEYALKEMRSLDLVPSGIVVNADIPPSPSIRKNLKPKLFYPGKDGSVRAPASPFPFEAQQPNGKKIALIRKGDEHLHWTETEDGYSVVRNPKNGFWEYAIIRLVVVLVPSGIPYIPNEAPPEGWPLHLKPSQQAGF